MPGTQRNSCASKARDYSPHIYFDIPRIKPKAWALPETPGLLHATFEDKGTGFAVFFLTTRWLSLAVDGLSHNALVEFGAVIALLLPSQEVLECNVTTKHSVRNATAPAATPPRE